MAIPQQDPYISPAEAAGEPEAIKPDPSFWRRIEERTGQKISACFLCRKCSSGCPLGPAMDLLPHQVVRMVQLGLKEEVLASPTLWLCASCQTCSTRCPNEIDIARLMDGLRELSLQEESPPGEPKVRNFYLAFLDAVRTHGRIHEIGLIARQKLRNGELFRDIRLGWEMIRRGKLRLLPSRIRNVHQVAAAFKKAEE